MAQVDQVKATGATIDVLENIQNEGGVKTLNQAAIDQLNKTKTDIETILNMGAFPTFTQAQVDQIKATGATIDVLEQIQNDGGVKSLDQSAIDQLNKTKDDMLALLNANLPIVTEEQKAQTETILASVDRLENMTVPDLSGRADEINTAKANVDFILGLSDLPTKAELDQVDAKVQQLAPLLPSLKQMNDTIANLVSRVNALESNGGGSPPSGPTYFAPSGVSVINLNPTVLVVALPEGGTYTATDLRANQFTVDLPSRSIVGASLNDRYLYITLDKYVPPSATLTLTMTETPIANSQGHLLQLSSFSVDNKLSVGKELTYPGTYSMGTLRFEASAGSVTITDTENESTSTTLTFRSDHGVYHSDGYNVFLHLVDKNENDNSYNGTMKLSSSVQLVTLNPYVAPLTPTSVTVHHIEPNKIEIVLPTGSYTVSDDNAFSVTGKVVTNGSLSGNILTLTLNNDVVFGDTLSVTLSTGSITKTDTSGTVALQILQS